MSACRVGASSLSGERGEIRIKDMSGKSVAFTPVAPPIFDFKNDYLTVAVTDSNNNMIQVNGLNTDEVTVAYIQFGEGKSSFSAAEQVRVKVATDNFLPGTPIRLVLRTRLYAEGVALYEVFIRLHGSVPDRTDVIINEVNIIE